jgi:Peptidase family M48
MNHIYTANYLHIRHIFSRGAIMGCASRKISINIVALAVVLLFKPSLVLASATDMRVNNIYQKVGVASYFACEIYEPSGEVSPCGRGVSIVKGLTSNAWARGDQIYLTNRIVRQCSDDELAFVIAHELSHIILQHRGSSIKNELEADSMAARIMYRSGFDANSAKVVLSRLQYARILGFPFSLFSHPANTRRLQAIGLALQEEVALNSDRLAMQSDAATADLLASLNSDGIGRQIDGLSNSLMASLAPNSLAEQSESVEGNLLASLNSEGPVAQPAFISTVSLVSLKADGQRTSTLSPSFSMLAEFHQPAVPRAPRPQTLTE